MNTEKQYTLTIIVRNATSIQTTSTLSVLRERHLKQRNVDGRVIILNLIRMERIASSYVEFKCQSYCTSEEHGKENGESRL